MRADRRADDVVCGIQIDDPGSHGLIDGVAEGAAAGLHGHDGCAQQFDPEHVERLAAHVLGAHVDGAGHAELGADRRGGDAVLARARFRDDARFAETSGQQDLAERVVDLVRARVVEVFAFQPDVGGFGSCMGGQAFG